MIRLVIRPSSLVAALRSQMSDLKKANDTHSQQPKTSNQEAERLAEKQPTSTALRAQEHAAKPEHFPIVGIGASAGGLAALKEFFAHVPKNSGLAYVIVVHLSPEHESHLSEILQPHISIPVQQVSETVSLERNRVYVIPPNANLDTIDTHLRLSELEKRRQERAPIDHFLRTLAKTHASDAIGVILTGTGSDGTLGLREIKAAGGLCVVQDPNDAEYDGMPQSAINTGIADLVLPVSNICSAILDYVSVRPQVPHPKDPEEDADGDSERHLLHKVFAQLRARTGRDFNHYKRSTISRRIQRRMQICRIEKFSDYVSYLRDSPEEVRTLADDLLITVTNFFRDPDVFELLERRVIPQLFDSKKTDRPIRVWCVGCATGEEAYSMAILLSEEASRREVPIAVQIFASDIHQQSLEKAREGFYPGDIDADVSPERIKRFFHKEDSGYRIRKEVRELVLFAPHNLMSDPPFSRIDLICCRNVLIYIRREVQHDIIELFHYALRPDGYLVLGTSETIDASDLFQSEDKQACIYRKRNVPAPEPRLPVFPLTRAAVPGERHQHAQNGEPIAFGSLHHRMVEQYAPPSLLLSPDDKLVHLSEHAGRYLVHPGGEPTTNIYKLIREELRVELRSATHTAREQKTSVRAGDVKLQFDDKTSFVTLHVSPTKVPQEDGFLLVVFEERGSADAQSSLPGTVDFDSDSAQATNGGREHQLATELATSGERLQSIIEDYEISQEHLRASNEELQSANEELRSTLEELETSKEELQSTNEELQTVNQENSHKVEELAQLSGDLQNLMAATDIATLFLDRDLRILRFTLPVGKLFNVRMTDRGRPLADITHRLGYDNLLNDAEQVLARLTPIEREVQDEKGAWYITRVLPYRTSEDRIQGVVITFIEINSLKQSQENLRQSEQRLRKILDIDEVGVLFFDPQGKLMDANRAFLKLTGYTREDVESGRMSWRAMTPPEYVLTSEQQLDMLKRTGHIGPYEKEYLRKDGSRMWMMFTGAQIEPNLIAEYCVDITDRKRYEEELREADRRKDEFLAMLGHELRNPLAAIKGGIQLLQSEKVKQETRSAAIPILARQVEHMETLINDILDVTRVIQNKISIQPTTIKLQQIVEHAVELVREHSAEKKCRLSFNMPSTAIVIEGDPVRLTQVFSNILSNAIKYSGAKCAVDIFLEKTDSEAVVRIRDNGLGIAPDLLPFVFDLFVQSKRSLDRSEGGLGLGLTVVRKLVEMHGGRVQALSEGEGKGSEFRVYLPLAMHTS
jgi:two-component system CheB/CheR fusion protein